MNDATPMDKNLAGAALIKRGRKFDQVLDGARTVFLADGYEGASVDAIARAAGVSKATLYSYFPDKRLLFMEVAKAECCGQIDETEAFIADGVPVREGLRDAATRMVDLVLSEFGQAVFRMCVAESERFPELGREFFENGPAVFKRQLCAFLRAAEDRGEVVVPDVELAADQFVELCHAHLFVEHVFGIRTASSAADKARVIEGAIDTFMARYGAA